MVKVKRTRTKYRGKFFSIKSVDILFPKGMRTHEYTEPHGKNSVIVVPLDKRRNVLLVEMYCTAMKKRELLCVAGLVDKGETPVQAARRECQEEIGFRPKKLKHIGTVETSPGYLIHTSEIYLATQLVPSKLEGDEPEDIKVVKIPLKKTGNAIKRKKIMHASSIAALLMAEKHLTIT